MPFLVANETCLRGSLLLLLLLLLWVAAARCCWRCCCWDAALVGLVPVRSAFEATSVERSPSPVAVVVAPAWLVVSSHRVDVRFFHRKDVRLLRSGLLVVKGDHQMIALSIVFGACSRTDGPASPHPSINRSKTLAESCSSVSLSYPTPAKVKRPILYSL